MAQRNLFKRAGKMLAVALILSAIVAVAWWDRAVSLPPREAERLLARDDFFAWPIETSDDVPSLADKDHPASEVVATNLPRSDFQFQDRLKLEPSVSSHLPGGGLPLVPASARDELDEVQGSPRRDQSPQLALEEPGRIHVDNAKPIAAAQQPAKLSFNSTNSSSNLLKNVVSREEAKPEIALIGNGGTRLSVEVQPVPKFLQAVSHEEPLSPEEHSLFITARKLHAPETAADARQQLIAQGLPPHIVAFAQAATDDDWRLRLQVVEAVPRLAGIDGPTWLLHLSHDEAAEVRQAAVAIMATSGDARYSHRLEQVAATDADDRVRAQARKATTTPR